MRSGTLTVSAALAETMKFPNGARFYRCALQVNPYDYVKRHPKGTTFAREDEYNRAIVDKCLELGIEVIAVTDHYRVDGSEGLLKAARDAGIHALPGFEAVSSEGVHVLCIFDKDKDATTLTRAIGECGIHNIDSESPLGSKNVGDLLECVSKSWKAVAVAAHVSSDGGLLRTLKGQTRMKAWKSEHLLACALPGPVADAVDEHRPILENKDAGHKRENPIAVINASDVSSPNDLEKPSVTTYIKMSEVSAEALRQAFLDSGSRIRLNSDEEPERHTQFLAMSWEGGFLDGTRIHFNENLNVLIGGRGTGKSTIIESLRYVLGLAARGDEASRAFEGVVRHVLKSGTKVSLLVRSYHPSERVYTIERTVPNPAVVKDSEGEVLDLTPEDVVGGVELFGQHEISELTRSEEKLTGLLQRFVEDDLSTTSQRSRIKLELEKSRRRILEATKEIHTVDERLAALPGFEETLKRYQEAGLEDKLRQKSLLLREERVVAEMKGRISPFSDFVVSLREQLPIDAAFLSERSLQDLPNRDVLEAAKAVFDDLTKEIESAANAIDQSIEKASGRIRQAEADWDVRRKKTDEEYEQLLRELQKSNIDGEEFIKLRRKIEDLRPLKERRTNLEKELNALQQARKKLLDEWLDVQGSDFRTLDEAAKRVSKKLKGRVRVKVTNMGNRGPLEKLLREKVGGNLASAIEKFQSKDDLSLTAFAENCRQGKEALVKQYGLSDGAADRIATADSEVPMLIEELELPATTQIELNTAPEGEEVSWQSLDSLSTGQKATAVLLLLLLESDAPLVVDQPEDDLDNRFITEGVVPTMRKEKRRRQFVFSTHNANIPVLGDAELILGLSTSPQTNAVKGRISTSHMGSIDSKAVREMVEEILEGGKTAFEMRRMKYGF